MGWLLLHLAVRAAAISVDSVWVTLDSLSKSRLARVAAVHRTDTTAAFVEAWEDYCRKWLEQGFTIPVQDADSGLSEAVCMMERRVKCCQLFRAVPQSASRGQLMREQEAMAAWRQRLMVNQDPYAEEEYRIDTCWVRPERQPEELELALDTLPLGEWSEPLVTPMGIHLLKVLSRDTMQVAHPVTLSDGSRLEQLKAKHAYRPQQELIDRLSKGNVPDDGVLFYLGQRSYTLSTYRLFVSSRRSSLGRCFDAFLKKSLLDAEVQELLAGPHSLQRLSSVHDSLMIHHLLTAEIASQPHDDAALEAWYQAHAAQFRQPIFKGLVLHCIDKQQGRALRKFLKRLPESERRRALVKVFAEHPDETPGVEEGVFYAGSNPYVDALLFQGAPAVPHPQRPYVQLVGRKMKGPDNYQEVRQEVMKRYQLELIRQLIGATDEEGNVEN